MSSAETLLNPSLHILQNFRDDEDPIDVIATIQKENRVRVPSVQPAMSFLDLHEMSREEVHQSLLQKLKETLTCRLGTLEPRAMKRLLDKSFQYIAVPELRSVVMGILEAMPRPIQERYESAIYTFNIRNWYEAATYIRSGMSLLYIHLI